MSCSGQIKGNKPENSPRNGAYYDRTQDITLFVCSKADAQAAGKENFNDKNVCNP